MSWYPRQSGAQIPLGRLASMEYVVGPPSIKSEGAKPNAWVYVDIHDVDVGGYVDAAREAVAERNRPARGLYPLVERTVRVHAAGRAPNGVCHPGRTLLLIAAIIYISRKSVAETLLVLLGAPFALTGAIWLLYVLDYNLSIAVWVGIIALAGLYAGDGDGSAPVSQCLNPGLPGSRSSQ